MGERDIFSIHKIAEKKGISLNEEDCMRDQIVFKEYRHVYG